MLLLYVSYTVVHAAGERISTNLPIEVLKEASLAIIAGLFAAQSSHVHVRDRQALRFPCRVLSLLSLTSTCYICIMYVNEPNEFTNALKMIPIPIDQQLIMHRPRYPLSWHENAPSTQGSLKKSVTERHLRGGQSEARDQPIK